MNTDETMRLLGLLGPPIEASLNQLEDPRTSEQYKTPPIDVTASAKQVDPAKVLAQGIELARKAEKAEPGGKTASTVAQTTAGVASALSIVGAVKTLATEAVQDVKRVTSSVVGLTTRAAGTLPDQLGAGSGQTSGVASTVGAVLQGGANLAANTSTVVAAAVGAGLAAIGGPIGAAVGTALTVAAPIFGATIKAAVEPLIGAITALEDIMASTSQALMPWSPDLIMQSVDAMTMGMQRDMRRAEDLGPLLADYQSSKTNLTFAMQNVSDQIISSFGPWMIKLIDFVTDISEDVPKRIAQVKDVLDYVNLGVVGLLAFFRQASEGQLIQATIAAAQLEMIEKNTRKDEDTALTDPFGDYLFGNDGINAVKKTSGKSDFMPFTPFEAGDRI